jgi:peroxiredoxin
MSIKEKLAALRETLGLEGTAKAPAAMLGAFTELVETEARNRPLRVGDVAPLFALRDGNGVLISSHEMLGRGPVVVTFYRGLWCPYCQRDLQSFEETLEDLRAENASVAAISHQLNSDGSRRFQRDNPISFPVLEDETGDVAVRFGIRWAPDDLSAIQEHLGIPATFQGTEPWITPMQARYVVGQDGMIAFAEVAFDYSERTDPTTVLPILRQWAAGSQRNSADGPLP